MKAFIVFKYWNVPSQNFENYHKPPFRLTQLIYYILLKFIEIIYFIYYILLKNSFMKLQIFFADTNCTLP